MRNADPLNLAGPHNAKRVWARELWQLCRRVVRKVLSHTVAIWVGVSTGHRPLRFEGLLAAETCTTRSIGVLERQGPVRSRKWSVPREAGSVKPASSLSFSEASFLDRRHDGVRRPAVPGAAAKPVRPGAGR